MYAPTIGIISSQESLGKTPLAIANTNTAMKFIAEVEDCGQRHRQGDHHAREPHLPKHPLPCEETLNGSRRRLEKVVPEHDRREEIDRVVRDPLAELEDVREDDVEDAEEQQRSHQRPEVAEHGSEVTQLEFRAGERQGQFDEPSNTAAEGRRPVNAGTLDVPRTYSLDAHRQQGSIAASLDAAIRR